MGTLSTGGALTFQNRRMCPRRKSSLKNTFCFPVISGDFKPFFSLNLPTLDLRWIWTRQFKWGTSLQGSRRVLGGVLWGVLRGLGRGCLCRQPGGPFHLPPSILVEDPSPLSKAKSVKLLSVDKVFNQSKQDVSTKLWRWSKPLEPQVTI